jgi:hypothetical protein
VHEAGVRALDTELAVDERRRVHVGSGAAGVIHLTRGKPTTMQHGNICVLQHPTDKSGSPVPLFIGTKRTPIQAAETLALVLDRTRDLWSGKATPERVKDNEGQFATALIAQFADSISEGKVTDVGSLQGLSVTAYPAQSEQSIMVDSFNRRVWLSPSGTAATPSSDRAVNFDQYIEAATDPATLSKLLGL